MNGKLDRRTVLQGALLAGAGAMLPRPATASGELDGAFGGDGKVITHLHGGCTAAALALQPDGKILVAGVQLHFPFDPLDPKRDQVIIRYNVDGSLDPTFGAGGVVRETLGNPYHAFETVGMLVWDDGSIFVARNSATGGTNYIEVSRYEVGGREIGRLSLRPGLSVRAHGLSRSTAGGLLLPVETGPGGPLYAEVTADLHAFIIRRLPLHTDIAGRSVAVLDTPAGFPCIAMRTGLSNYSVYDTEPGRFPRVDLLGMTDGVAMAIAGNHLYCASGSIVRQSARSDGGRLSRPPLPIQRIRTLAVDSSGSVLAAGSHKANAAVGRLRPDGSVDPSFGANGTAVVDFNGSRIDVSGLAVAPDGKIVLAGTRQRHSAGDSVADAFAALAFVVARLNA